MNKSQMILLALLVSFVTSIATGIVTVTLMDQAPPGVTQTINRVVERTVEKVVPGEPQEQIIVKEVPITVPVTVNQDDLVAKVIETASSGVAQIADDRGKILGSAVLIQPAGFLVTVAKLLPRLVVGQEYKVVIAGGNELTAKLMKVSTDHDIALLKIEGAVPEGLAGFSLAETDILPGQTVIAFGVNEDNLITATGGVVSSLTPLEAEASSDIILVQTTAVTDQNRGGPVLNTQGKIVGINQTLGLALAVGSIRELINSIIE